MIFYFALLLAVVFFALMVRPKIYYTIKTNPETEESEIVEKLSNDKMKSLGLDPALYNVSSKLINHLWVVDFVKKDDQSTVIRIWIDERHDVVKVDKKISGVGREEE